MIKDIAFVGYPTKDIKKAREFYEGVLGFVPSDEFGPITDESHFIEYPVGNSTIALGQMDTWLPSKDGPSAAFEVDNLKELVETVRSKGYEVMMEVMEFPNCSMGIVRDADSNMVTLHQKK